MSQTSQKYKISCKLIGQVHFGVITQKGMIFFAASMETKHQLDISYSFQVFFLSLKHDYLID